MGRRKKKRVRLRWSGSRAALQEHENACRHVRDRAVPMRKSESRELKKACKDVLSVLQDIRQACYGHGISVECVEFATDKRPSLHVMFNDMQNGVRLLNWWPGTGKWIGRDGRRGMNTDVREVVELATVQ